MQPRLKRSELDSLAEFYSLDGARTAILLELAGAQPTRAEGFRFVAACLRIAGVLSLAAGLVFFVAANWVEIAVFGRFALIELTLLACTIVAWVKPPPAFIPRGGGFALRPSGISYMSRRCPDSFGFFGDSLSFF